jgi:tetratricopeptide (TPR) repeat protein
MLTLIISVALSTALSLGLYLITYKIFWPVVLMAVGILGFNYLIGKTFLKKITALFKSVEKDLAAGRSEKAIEKLKTGYEYGKWQFFVKEQIDSQIGIILYTNKQFDESIDYLKNAFSKNWMAMCMLGAWYYRNQDYDNCFKTMDKAVKKNAKQGFVYALYAYFLSEQKDKDKAIEVLSKGVEKNPIDERLSSSLDALKNGKKLKMQNYGNYWLQMHLGGKQQQGAKQYQQFLMNQRGMKRR